MPIVMNMRWDGVTREEYEEARDQVGWEHFNRFVENRLMPVVQEIGIQTQPDLIITEMHAVWNPGVERTAPAAV